MFRKSGTLIHRIVRPRSAAILWSLVVLSLLVAPVPAGGEGWFLAVEWLGVDKLVHLSLFGAEGFLVHRWLRSAGVRSPGVWAVGLTVVFGALTELIQVPLPDRQGDVWDLAADSVGAVLAVLAGGLWVWIYRRRAGRTLC